MGEERHSPYSPRQHQRAVVLSALLGWAGVTAMALDVTNLNQFLGLLPFAAAVGLPISFLLTLVVGGPILRRLMLRSVNWIQAAYGGALVALIISLISVVVGRLLGLAQSMDPDSFSQLGGGEFIIELDGILTPYGWYLLAIRTFVFVALGAGVGLIARLVIGPGNRAR